MHFTTPARVDDDLKEAGHGYRGRFVDLRTFTYALTDRGFTLYGAAAAFGVTVRKSHAEHTGRMMQAYVGYNRQDVRTTAALYDTLTSEWSRHPIDLQPSRPSRPPRSPSRTYVPRASPRR